MVSHYDCENQQNLQQFNYLIVKQSTKTPSDIQYGNVKPQSMSEQILNVLKLLKVKLTLKQHKFVFKAPLNIDVLIERLES